MATGDVSVQSAVHSLEQGRLAFYIKAGMFVALIIALVLIFLFVHFKGFSEASAMDQAQIARNLADGRGFTTKNVTPLALDVLRKAERIGVDNAQVDLERFPDIYQSPLVPWIHSFALRLTKGSWKMESQDLIYAGDRLIAFLGMVFMLLGVGVWYFVFRRLFDAKLAFYASLAVLVTDILWQFSMSGLPQPLLLLLFGCASLLTLHAEDAQARMAFVPMVAMLFGAGLTFGLMILAHGLSAWIFIGWLLYASFVFRPRGLMVLAALGAALLVVAPWLVRNIQVCGNPLGLAFFGAFNDGSAFTGYLRGTEPISGLDLKGIFRRGVTSQLGAMPAYFGINIAAMSFFLAILHRFRNENTSLFRWGLALMWLMALIGMCFYRPQSEVSDNQLHILFLPVFTAYGFAFLLVLWGRWEFGQGLLRIVFIVGVIAACGAPLLMTLLAGPSGRVQWPPYVPPFIAVMGDWFEEDEILASDMPWAVAWYANRNSLLLPLSVRDLNRMHDYREFKQNLSGVYLTPISGNQPLYSSIYKGAAREWAPLITRPPEVRGFPFAFFTALPIDGECIVFSDRERWIQPRKTQ